MSERDDRIIADRLAAFAAPAGDADWNDVLRRARRKGTRRLAIALAPIAVIALAAPAFGLSRTVIDWFAAEPAPPRTELSFSKLDAGAPRGLETGVIQGTARRAFDTRLPEGMRATVWVAPTARGGFCEMIELAGASGHLRGSVGPSCDDRDNATGYGSAIPGPISAGGSIERGPVVIDGYATVSRAVAVVIRHEDGAETKIALTWVSPPINAGFFVHGVPPARWTPGGRPTQLRYIDAGGRTVGQTYEIRLGPG